MSALTTKTNRIKCDYYDGDDNDDDGDVDNYDGFSKVFGKKHTLVGNEGLYSQSYTRIKALNFENYFFE